MKVVLFVVMSLLCAPVLVEAQSPVSHAQAVAQQFCSCVNTTYSNIDEDVKQSMGKIVSFKLQNQPKDLEKYMKRLPAELVIRIQEQATQFKRNGALAQHCIHVMEKEMEAVDLENPIYEGMTKNSFSRLIQQELGKDDGCTFAALLLELGIREQPNAKPQVHISQTRSGETVGAAVE